MIRDFNKGREHLIRLLQNVDYAGKLDQQVLERIMMSRRFFTLLKYVEII